MVREDLAFSAVREPLQGNVLASTRREIRQFDDRRTMDVQDIEPILAKRLSEVCKAGGPRDPIPWRGERPATGFRWKLGWTETMDLHAIVEFVGRGGPRNAGRKD